MLLRRQPHVISPSERSLRPLCIRRIPRIPREPGRELEEAPAGDCVLVRVPVVEGEDLPAEAAAAAVGIPTSGLRVEDSLREGEPLRLGSGGVWETLLGGGDGG